MRKTTVTILYAIICVLLLHSSPAMAALSTLSSLDWNTTAVRKVLHTFAFGGFASDAQIKRWADMLPNKAIAEILTLSPTNELLSPAEDVAAQKLTTSAADTTLETLQDWLSSDAADNPVPLSLRYKYHPLATDLHFFNVKSLQETWLASATTRGINPFRQAVGLWLTNYLLSVHLHSVNNNHLLIRSMYDDMMSALGEGKSFAEVLAIGASSAALARQYGHMNNRMQNDTFLGNDDFGREFHQLVFGILGELPKTDPQRAAYKDYYEKVTVEGTARALTGMQLSQGSPYGILRLVELSDINFFSFENQAAHHMAPLEVLNFDSPGTADTFGFSAQEKILSLSQRAINNPESEAFLPVRIVQHFGDSTLTIGNTSDPRIVDIRESWIKNNKNLLEFIRDYAVSTQFHSPQRIKYYTAFERNLLITNRNSLTNVEGYNNLSNPINLMKDQGADLFRPAHFVFGGQTGIDAIDNSSIFKTAYNSNVVDEYFLGKANFAGTTLAWEKDWSAVLPTNSAGEYVVNDIARWLWNRFIADGGKNYTIQERAYITAFLAYGIDFTKLASTRFGTAIIEDGYSSADLADYTQPYFALILECERSIMDFNSTPGKKLTSNLRIGRAINFITATPFMFYAEGR